MMEVEPLSYIFGSFSRRRQNHETSSPSSKRHSADDTDDDNNDVVTTINSSPKSIISSESIINCPLCHKSFIEPRVLKCLHTFCTNCLLQLQEDAYSSEQTSSVSEYFSIHTIECPTCTDKTQVQGIQDLPINYLLLHRMILQTLNSSSTTLLCDICPGEVTASCRCTECAYSFCSNCAANHQTSNKKHDVLSLDEARKRGICKVRRQIMCQRHPENELLKFCSTCSQVLCTECGHTFHKNHTLESPEKLVKVQTTNIRVAVERTKSNAEKAIQANARLESKAESIEAHCDRIEKEIESFTDRYIRAVQEHRRKLFEQLGEARREKLQWVANHRIELQRRAKNAQDAIQFCNDLLKEGSDIEVLTFVDTVMNRLESCYQSDCLDFKISESLQFLPEELSVNPDDEEQHCCPLYGVITTQTVSVKNCSLNVEGLQNLRVGRRAEAILETKDSSDNNLQRGGEEVAAELLHRDAGAVRNLPVYVEDKRDGTYRISFVPDVAGKLFLSVFVKREILNDCPYGILVRSMRAHRGTFHCCTFCSSAGTKDALCGCKGKMPGGYKGCGHGHDGHPGRRHWSCCGNVLEHSECSRTNSITHYQFTL